ncbi:MAG: 3-mercaptopyruvate sulfurtransferase [Rhizobiaceae bacterium]
MNKLAKSPFVVSVEWLADRLGKPDVVVVDGSWYLPDANRNGKAEYVEAHIPGAVFFDIDAIADTASGLPHMLPAPEDFARVAGAMGIADTDTIVIYDGAGLFSAARVWWTFRTFGAQNVFILDGGMPAWKAGGFAVSKGIERPKKKQFTAKLQAHSVVSKPQMFEAVASGKTAIADARPEGRFVGTVPEPRPGLRGGHMPGASSVPIGLLVENGMLKSPAEIEAVFRNQRLDLTGDVVTTCGSGVTAAVLSLALESIGHKDHALYDGSWAEWGQHGSDTPVVLGPASIAASANKPRRFLKAHITELEMGSRPTQRAPLPIGKSRISLVRTGGMAPSFYRYLYEQVGKAHHWFIRRALNDEQLGAFLGSEKAEIWVLSVDGCPAGFFEIDLSVLPKTADIQYFGLIDHYRGKGLAKFMLSEAVHAAWDRNPEKVTIQTNTLDSPKALILYQKAGFEPVGAYDEMIEAWD